MKTFLDILVGYMTIAVLATQMNLDEKPFWVHFLTDKHMKILMMFAAAQAACNNLRASILATYIYYLTLDNAEFVVMFVKDISKLAIDESSNEETKEKDEDKDEEKDKEQKEEDPMKMFF